MKKQLLLIALLSATACQTSFCMDNLDTSSSSDSSIESDSDDLMAEPEVVTAILAIIKDRQQLLNNLNEQYKQFQVHTENEKSKDQMTDSLSIFLQQVAHFKTDIKLYHKLITTLMHKCYEWSWKQHIKENYFKKEISNIKIWESNLTERLNRVSPATKKTTNKHPKKKKAVKEDHNKKKSRSNK